MKRTRPLQHLGYLYSPGWIVGLLLLLLLAACGPTPDAVKPQQTVVISPKFQVQTSPIPTPPTYRCGAWVSNNAPNAFAKITLYARLTKDVTGVQGATATAVVHFENGDVTLDAQPQSDDGGYVTFTLNLQGRQPNQLPATIDVFFTNFPGGRLKCTPAFFTPQ